MIAAIRTELLKVRTTRLWWVMLGLMIVTVAGLTALLAALIDSTTSDDPAAGGGPVVGTSIVYSMAVGFGYVFPLIMGTLSVTGEFRYQTLTPTYLSEPRRGVVVAGKTVGQFVTGLVFGIVTVAVAVGVGAGTLAVLGNGTGLGEGSIERSLALSPLALGLWAVIGVGLGALIRNQVAAIVVIIAFNQIIDPILRAALSGLGGHGVVKFLPTSAAESMSGGGLGSLLSPGGSSDSLAWWGGGLVLLAYGIVFIVLGWVFTLRRDVS
jgi:ABC-2 type transport system permease protein